MHFRPVEVVNRNGDKQLVPAGWLAEGHPFADQFTKTPSTRQMEERSATPDDSWTVPQLRTYAKGQGIDLAGVTTKADYLSVINNHEPATSAGEE